jgi:hypothetical protein
MWNPYSDDHRDRLSAAELIRETCFFNQLSHEAVAGGDGDEGALRAERAGGVE